MKKLLFVLLMTVALVADAKGGFSSGGGRSSGFSSAGRSYSAPARSYSPPSSTRSYSAPSRSTTTTITTSRVTRSGGGYYGGSYYGSMGMGYGYSNGLVTGMILGNLMHPTGTVVYAGGGQYNNNALLYPDGRVVNQQGYQVGTYVDGQFTPMDGGMVAQPAPPPQAAPTPVVIHQDTSAGELAVFVLIVVLMIVLMGALLC